MITAFRKWLATHQHQTDSYVSGTSLLITCIPFVNPMTVGQKSRAGIYKRKLPTILKTFGDQYCKADSNRYQKCKGIMGNNRF